MSSLITDLKDVFEKHGVECKYKDEKCFVTEEDTESLRIRGADHCCLAKLTFFKLKKANDCNIDISIPGGTVSIDIVIKEPTETE